MRSRRTPEAEAGAWAGDLVSWFAAEARELPWRARRNAYTTWVSEVMLQQTTVETVLARYEDFLSRFPSIEALGSAAEDDVLAAWSGLGYYRRARGLHAGARRVLADHAGRIPDDEVQLRALPGVGPYTAKAILALAFDRPVVPVDGNVARVAARVFGDDADVGKEATRRRLGQRLEELVPEDHAAAFAEALIELGALVCRPVEPACLLCPVRAACVARREGSVDRLPVKAAPRAATHVVSVRALLRRRGRVLMVRRSATESLLPGFWELPGRWVMDETPSTDVLGEVLSGLGLGPVAVGELAATTRHSITHHRIRAEAWAVDAGGRPRGGRFLDVRELQGEVLTTETRKLLERGGLA